MFGVVNIDTYLTIKYVKAGDTYLDKDKRRTGIGFIQIKIEGFKIHFDLDDERDKNL